MAAPASPVARIRRVNCERGFGTRVKGVRYAREGGQGRLPPDCAHSPRCRHRHMGP
jgi:hypothetical protein